MNTPAVLDDYLHDLLGELGTATVAPSLALVVEETAVTADTSPDAADTPAPPIAKIEAPPALAIAPVRPGSDADMIDDDEFEALLDQLHGSGAPAAVAAPASEPIVAAPTPPAPALAVAPARAGSAGDMISDDEFEALLDDLHGGAAPTARIAGPAPVAAPAAPAVQAPRALAPLPSKPYLQEALPDTGERRRATERKTRWLRLRCDQQHYALELLKVQEVVRPATLLPLRGAAPHMLGVMNLRGQVVPVIDMGLYLGRSAIDTDAATRIVVLEEHGEILGLRVSAVEDVANLTDNQIESPDNARVGRIANPLFRGVARLNERAVILLDASQVLQ